MPSSTGLKENVAGALSYLLGPITGILFLIMEKESQFVKFHAMQSTIVFGGLWVLSIILSFIPYIGWMLLPLINLIGLILWILLIYKAYSNEWFKLPVVGDIAEQQLGNV
ncbi:MAG: DUF4870 domain-containing protein [Archaeoglobus sp.]|uniref:DUF4870 domain-containing protein n=1 Tax=Archaeoglobus sp. TaxID=1872626 RepID=UPI001D9B3117|nr:DUF4870 domain-containing protein [Archaeoglobus sp.]MBO8179916.1 DUF4870 domain-containing protein [Archaeoglobus sp.]